MHERAHRIAVIIGSTREGRFGPTVAQWLIQQATQRGDMDIDLVDLAEAGLPEAFTEKEPPAVTHLGARLRAADAFVVVTPEYNHGYPAALKTAIDWYQEEWHAKPVGFVSYGGASGGSRAIEQLRQVFAEVHATTVRDAVSFTNAWEAFGGDHVPVQAQAWAKRAKTLLDRLAWWSEALREARLKRPYQTSA
ncbi:NAD(P)H-dependent FMN reductase [Hydrogenophaga palleronii]|uniref:NAD(P)H-dependent FMN reductase n=1 Tax=Hydrogenophaga palleronii TaxID=65655 RepID=A0ABU1WTH8_9BURK|nr:NAD(P)H-dependent oxidoreductase [Hydrogenophaga palleronii]MDR7152489.1 NAD(P)H-dependent FMN reductase [Hydrogenophaga palleronii]